MRKLSALLIAISVTITLLSIYYKHYADMPLSNNNAKINLIIEPGMSFNSISQQLKKFGLISNELPWNIFGRLNGATDEIKAGEYSIAQNLSPRQLLSKLIQGDTIQFSLTVVEGWTFKQLWEAVKKHEKITQTVKTQIELLEKLDFKNRHPEGWFYPDTYFFPTGTTDVDFFQRAFQHMIKVLDEEWPKRQGDVPLKSPNEALILASIIEKETSVEDERKMVAAVFVTRLKRGMRLQTDPTVIYGLGESYDGNIRRKDLKSDTPYNTYLHKGLPPTPIALPGRASITAALNPANSDVVYFVSKGDGTHHFSSTYEEHREAVIKYQLNGNKNLYKADNDH
ncbi:MAG: endolytic transglycosylase MltG [Gammaproteobacteria bacterium]